MRFLSARLQTDLSLSPSLKHIHAFCIQHPEYYPSSIETVTTLQQLCLDFDGGETTKNYLSDWLSKLESANERDLEKCSLAGHTRAKPMIYLAPTKKTTRILSVPTIVLPSSPPIIDRKPLISVDICKPTVDPRRRRRSLVVESPMTVVEDDVDATQSFALPPPQPLEAVYSPPEDLTFDDSLCTRSASALPQASLGPSPGSNLECVQSFGTKHPSSLLPASSISSAHTHPTPSPTPELVSPAHEGPEFLQSHSTLFGPTVLSKGCCTRLPFKLSERSLHKLRA